MIAAYYGHDEPFAMLAGPQGPVRRTLAIHIAEVMPTLPDV